MWVYHQCSGCLEDDKGLIVGVGYSGAEGSGKNIPRMQNVRNVGPIPQGIYAIGDPYDSQAHGPFVLPLIPGPTNEMFGRSGFLIHGDSLEHPGAASEGCIIMSRQIREEIAGGDDRSLKVVA